ncbi:MAG: hypothetical protein IJ644_05070 [Oscillospiraceae bacterium]|nr:hypothetical protein [Oscillospiraceae bacterium]
MKNNKLIPAVLLLTGLLTACGNTNQVQASTENAPAEVSPVSETEEFVIPQNPDADPASDVDLTVLSSTMVYSQVADMMYTPEKYDGKIVKASGLFSVYHDDSQDKNYYAVLIQDATACCAQGIEFIWQGEHNYPEDYPEIGQEITVMGTFGTYEEDGATYTQLLDATLTVNS